MAYQGQFTSGSVLTAAELNVFTPVTVLEESQSIPDATETVIAFSSAAIYDAPDWHSTTVNNSRITPDVQGIYLATAHYTTGSSAVDYAFSRFYKNGGVIANSIVQFSGTNIIGSHANSYYLEMNGTTDYIEYKVYQSSGSARPGSIQLSLQLVAGT